MYNEELKQRYIDYKESTAILAKNYIFRIFRDSESFESAKGKDISNFSTSEIIEFYQMLNRTSVETLSVINSLLSQYTNWCLMQNLVADNQNHFLEITRDRYGECVNTLYVEKSILSRHQVLEMTTRLENYCDKFILLALFEGINGKDFKELWSAHYSDVNEGNKSIVLCTGRTINISTELINYAYEAGKATEYYALGDTGRKYDFLDTDDTIVKRYMNCKDSVSEHQMGRRIYTKVDRLVDFIGMDWLRPQNFIDSGKIYFINMRSEELGINGSEFIMNNEFKKEVEKQFNCTISRSNFVSRYNQFLR